MKKVSKKHKEKLSTFLPITIKLSETMLNNDFDLSKRYVVSGLETKIKGIDILSIADTMLRGRNNPVNKLTVKGGLYFDENDNCVGFIGANGDKLFHTGL